LFSGFDDHIVDVGFYVFPNMRTQALLYRLLVGRTSVFQAKCHNLIAVDVVRHYECCLVFIVGVQGYLVVPRIVVEEVE
jgi:hypothetical protein